MPVTAAAKKKLRRDRKKTIVNLRIKRRFKEAIKEMRRHPSQKALRTAYRLLDRAAKKGVIHKNKAARLKSRLTKLLKKAKIKK